MKLKLTGHYTELWHDRGYVTIEMNGAEVASRIISRADSGPGSEEELIQTVTAEMLRDLFRLVDQ